MRPIWLFRLVRAIRQECLEFQETLLDDVNAALKHWRRIRQEAVRQAKYD